MSRATKVHDSISQTADTNASVALRFSSIRFRFIMKKLVFFRVTIVFLFHFSSVSTDGANVGEPSFCQLTLNPTDCSDACFDCQCGVLNISLVNSNSSDQQVCHIIIKPDEPHSNCFLTYYSFQVQPRFTNLVTVNQPPFGRNFCDAQSIVDFPQEIYPERKFWLQSQGSRVPGARRYNPTVTPYFLDGMDNVTYDSDGAAILVTVALTSNASAADQDGPVLNYQLKRYTKPGQRLECDENCEKDMTKFDCRCYWLGSMEDLSWQNASQHCKMKNMNLVSLMSPEEMTVVKYFIFFEWYYKLVAKYEFMSWIFIGLMKDEVSTTGDGEVSMTGEVFQFSPNYRGFRRHRSNNP